MDIVYFVYTYEARPLKIVCSICIFVIFFERELDWIYEYHVFDPRSTPLSLHNSTSNQASGK